MASLNLVGEVVVVNMINHRLTTTHIKV